MNLRHYITQSGQTAKEFAARIGASERAVIKWMRSERRPRAHFIAAIARETKGKVTATDFFPAPPSRERAA